MKELSIEEKARAYDEALVRAQTLNDQFKDSILGKNIEFIFPELKETEDEKIRKWLVALIKSNEYGSISSVGEMPCPKLNVIAWLEKQDSCYTFEIRKGYWYRCVCDYMLNGSDLMFKNDNLYYCRRDWRLRGEIDERNVKDLGINGYKSFFRPATNQEIKDWLEKQGEQKSIDKIQLGKKYKCIASPRYSTFMTGKIYKPEDNFLCSLMNFCSDCFEPIEDGEQESADKVEPKFKVGDWVVASYGKVNQIVSVDKDGDGYTLDDGVCFSGSWCDMYHLWTIQDAKDGDVLTYSDSKHTWLCIFKELKNQRCYDYCSYSNKDEVGFWPRSNWNYDKTLSYKPATKEQRDTLLKAMTDAGYTFDFEKKELKKIEEKSHEGIIDEINRKIFPNHYGGASVLDIHNPAEWSEEDEKEFEQLLDILHANGYESFDIWLKSLKERYTWKPSDEQLKSLKEVIDVGHFTSYPYALETLYEQLKKLMEEDV